MAGAVAANLCAYLLLRGPLDVDLRVARPGEALLALEAGPVIAVTVVPAVVAAGLATALRSRRRRLHQFVVAGWALALLSLWALLTLDVPTGTKAGLALLHLLPAAVVLPAVTARPSPIQARGNSPDVAEDRGLARKARAPGNARCAQLRPARRT